MGFGSYDESEQENQELDSDLDGETVNTGDAEHEGAVEFDIGASNDELLDQLQDMKGGEDDS